jgi:8-oxo-dGTP pyrophosphatase MutT (NUDIX family)
MIGDGDGWVECAAGHRHWGRFGAAGLLISDGKRVILQHRAPWTHEGDRWGLPGGARDSHEDPTSTALREAQEEADIDADLVEPLALSVDDHGGWSYTTVLARPAGVIEPHAANAESVDVTWWGRAEVDGLPLHHGFAAAWSRLQDVPARLVILVDAQASGRFPAMLGTDRAQLDGLVRRGIPVAALPTPRRGRGASSLLPRIVVFGTTGVDLDRSSVLAGPPPRWWQRHVSTVAAGLDRAAGSLDLAEPDGATAQVVVVTESAATGQRLAAGDGHPSVVGADWFVDQLDRHSSG